MIGTNQVIVFNIKNQLRKQRKTVNDLIGFLNMPKTEMMKYLSCKRMISYPVLKKISDFLEVRPEELLEISPDYVDPTENLLKQARTKETKEGILLASELADMVLYYDMLRENAEEAEKSW